MTDAFSQYALPLGTMVQEYRIKQVLGVGSFGIVYAAENKFFKETVALKEFLPTDLACREEGSHVAVKSSDTVEAYSWALKKFLEEARTLRELGRPVPHRNIVRVRQFIEANDTAYMVMDYEEGNPLSQVLKERGPLPEEELKGILEPLLDGLERVHSASVWHRDIKPSNILIRPNGSPVLIDFGAARREMAGAVRSVMTVFSPAYAAPEQVYGAGTQGPWTDIYSLGATLYRALTGKKPPNAAERRQGATYTSAVQATQSGYSRAFLLAVDAALELNPEDRPQSIMKWRRLLAEEQKPTAQKDDEPTVVRQMPLKSPDIAVPPVDLESALDGLAKDEADVDAKHEEIKFRPPSDGGEARKTRIFRGLLSKWTAIAGIALILLIILLWMGVPKKEDQKFGQALREFEENQANLSPTACDASVDPDSPVGIICAYFRACQRKDADSAVEKRSDLSPELAESLRGEIINSEYYQIIDVSLNEHTQDHAEVYTEYKYKRRGQTPVSYVGAVYLKKNNFNQWEIASITQTIDDSF